MPPNLPNNKINPITDYRTGGIFGDTASQKSTPSRPIISPSYAYAAEARKAGRDTRWGIRRQTGRLIAAYPARTIILLFYAAVARKAGRDMRWGIRRWAGRWVAAYPARMIILLFYAAVARKAGRDTRWGIRR